jgi:exopolysaccharide biosynthesis polyprenyl glycosylphosphotransferase
MTLIATGSAAATVELPIELVRETIARRPSRLSRLPWALFSADVVAAGLSTGLVAESVGTWPPTTAAVIAATWPAAVASGGGYSRAGAFGHLPRLGSLPRAAGTVSVTALAAFAVAPGLLDAEAGSTARSVLVLLLLASVVSGALRLLAGAMFASTPTAVVVAGDASGVRRVLEEVRRGAGRRDPRFVPVGICLEGDPANDELDRLAEVGDVPVWYGSAHLLDAVRIRGAEGVIVTPGPQMGHAELRRWGTWLQDEGVELLVHQGLRDVATSRLAHTRVGGAGLLHVRPAALSGPVRWLKDLSDRSLALVLLVGLAPLLGVLALLIRTESSGPALFRQTRVGRGGRVFTVYKLRTMCQDADRCVEALRDANESDPAGVLFKMKRDPRITPLGAKLRKFSLDELPQLLNVVRGEMSLIGPRPALPTEVRGYSIDLRRRLAVKPGLTGLWQVSGRSDLSWEEAVRLDLQYVDNWSWALDVKIALKTVRAVVGHQGAY